MEMRLRQGRGSPRKEDGRGVGGRRHREMPEGEKKGNAPSAGALGASDDRGRSGEDNA